MKELYTLKDVAELFQVTYRTAYNWHRAGLFPNAFRVNRKYVRIPIADIQSIQNAKEVGHA